MPQRSILGALLFNTFLCDLFLFLRDIPVTNNADDNTPYCTGLQILDVLIKLENAAETLLQWFKDNRMKANPDKYHLLINNTKESFQTKIGNKTVTNSKYEKLRGVKVDHELNFNEHVSLLYKKASQKLNALSQIASCMTFDQRKLILNSFITLHFSYCPIVWIFHRRKLNERINHIHERALTIVYKDFNLSFQELLIEDNSLNIHHRNLKRFVTEIFKVKNGLSPELMNDVFEFIEKRYSLRTTSYFRSRKIRTTKYGIETPSYLGPKLWNLAPNEYKTIESHADFKAKIKTWVPENLQVMQTIYSPNRLYLSSPHNNSRILIKSQYIKK